MKPASVHVTRLCWAYLIAAPVLWVTLRFGADRWWLATIIAYGPRWIWGLPAIGLLPLAFWFRRRMAWVVAGGALVVLFGVMGFTIPFSIHSVQVPQANKIRVLSCNMGGFSLDPAALIELIAQVKPDVVAIQEGVGEDAMAAAFAQLGWHVHIEGQQILASSFPIVRNERILSLDTWRTAAVHYTLQTPIGDVQFATVHLDTPRYGLEPIRHHERGAITALKENIDYRRQGSQRAAAWIASFGQPLIIAGDFNMPTDSAIFRECWSAYTDSFSAAGFGLGNTKFTKVWGVRIDHVLAGPDWHVGRCWVGPDIGSDHCPLIAELEWTGRP